MVCQAIVIKLLFTRAEYNDISVRNDYLYAPSDKDNFLRYVFKVDRDASLTELFGLIRGMNGAETK